IPGVICVCEVPGHFIHELFIKISSGLLLGIYDQMTLHRLKILYIWIRIYSNKTGETCDALPVAGICDLFQTQGRTVRQSDLPEFPVFLKAREHLPVREDEILVIFQAYRGKSSEPQKVIVCAQADDG